MENLGMQCVIKQNSQTNTWDIFCLLLFEEQAAKSFHKNVDNPDFIKLKVSGNLLIQNKYINFLPDQFVLKENPVYFLY